MADEKKTERITILCTKAQKKLIVDRADKDGLPFSLWILRLALNHIEDEERRKG